MVWLYAIVIFITAFFLLGKLSERLLQKIYCENILSDNSNYNSSLPGRLAAAVIGRKRVFRQISLPIPGHDGEEIQLGTVIVTGSGVFIVCLLNGNGIVENPADGNWKHISAGKITEFDNPFTVQRDARALLEYYMNVSGFQNIKAYTLVVYTGNALRFSYQKPRGVMTASEFTEKLTQMNKKRQLSASEIKGVCRVLSDVSSN